MNFRIRLCVYIYIHTLYIYVLFSQTICQKKCFLHSCHTKKVAPSSGWTARQTCLYGERIIFGLHRHFEISFITSLAIVDVLLFHHLHFFCNEYDENQV